MTDKFKGNDPEANDPENSDEMSFEELFNSYDEKIGQELKQGDLVEGKIISIGKSSVYIDTGTKSDGVIDKIELLDEDGQLLFQENDIIKLYVVSLSESEVILSKAISGAGKVAMLEDACHSQTPVEGKVTEVIKGGFNVDILGKRAFCPVSQIDVRYVETPEDYLGQSFHFLISRFEEKGRNIVVSRRDLLNEQIKEEQKLFLAKVAEGDVVQGRVSKLMPFGAFIELAPGVEGMAHISELSWSRVEKADDVVQTGDMVSVKLLKIEAREGDTPKISLSIKQVDANPWDSMGSAFKPGDQVMGRVVRLAAFGAFVELAPGVDGLVHISEMSHTKRVLRPEDVVQQGEQVQVVIKAIDQTTKRISLSIKDGMGDPWTGVSTKYIPGSVVTVALEKKETFGLFMNLEPGVTGLMPTSNLRNASNSADYDKLKPGDSVQVLVQEVDEDNRRITLGSPDQKDTGDWKQFAQVQKQETMGTMASLFQEAMDKKK